ncbi:exocyst complex component EXO70E2 [Humulus lupulus]|uniref:exocyst complex component EXO70E2 n=1 Tax=Humulus lupulus TaxID=3486 RepID=UPI002B4027C0|nr:exocyst complex component EXO70E2 [Humulus lupulus]
MLTNWIHILIGKVILVFVKDLSFRFFESLAKYIFIFFTQKNNSSSPSMPTLSEMENCKSATPTQEGKHHVMAAALHLTKALVGIDYLTDDLKKILSDLDSHLSAMVVITESKEGEFLELEQRLKQAEKKVASWTLNQLMVSDCCPIEASQNLEVIGEIHAMTESLRGLAADEYGKPMELLQRAESLLQTAMSKLEEEVDYILHQHKQYFEPEDMSFRSCGSDVMYDESFVSVEEDPQEEALRRNSSGSESEDYLVDLVRPHVMPHLKSVTNIMFASNYAEEFCQAFIKARKEALDTYWVSLGMETFSIEDVLKMEWKSLHYEIKRWSWIMKIIIRVYLPSEKRLCDQILGEFGYVSSHCFMEISKALLMYLLNFGEAVVMGDYKPEKLFRLLDMYEVLGDLLFDIDHLLLAELGSDIRIEFHDLLEKLGDFSRVTFSEFRHAIACSTSTTPYKGGGIHPLTKYVMNYIKALVEFGDTLNVLLKDQSSASSEDPNSVFELENMQEDSSTLTSCPTAYNLQSIASTLESNLNNRSKLYNNGALQNMFLMNNINYIVQKVKTSKLRLFFGDVWIREHMAKVQQQATGYERTSWSSAVSLIRSQDGHTLPKEIFKEKCRRFSVAFEEVYRNQTAWYIPDPQLREDLQISISQKVIQAYRSFTGRNSNDEKHIKYTADELENFLLHLFEGSPRSLSNPRRR